MDLFSNPFHILGVSTRDNRHRITELADERSLLFDPNSCMEARSDLTNPRKRLSVEVAWLPGIAPNRVEELLEYVKSSPEDLINIDKIPPLPRCNLLVCALANLPDFNEDVLFEWILDFSWEFERVDPEAVLKEINEERLVSGFPEVSDVSFIEAEIQERRKYYSKIIKTVLDKLTPKEIVNTITELVDWVTNKGREQGPILVYDLVDSYEIEAQEFLDKEERNIKLLVERIHVSVDEKKPDSLLAQMVNQLIQTVKNWDFVAQPIQVSANSRGLDHDASLCVSRLVRELAIHLFNEHDKLEYSQKITSMLQEVFAEVGKVAESTAEDKEILDKIADERKRKKAKKTLELFTGYNERSFGNLKPIDYAPTLYTINGCGAMLWGSTGYNPLTGQYIATYYFVLFFIPIFPIGRYLVSNNGKEYRFFGKLPLRLFDKLHIAILIGLIAALLFFDMQ